MKKNEFSGKTGRAGLPEQVIQKDFPKCNHISSDLDDTMTGIDEAVDRSVSKAKKHQSNQK